MLKTPQDVALLNLDMFMKIEGKYRKDLAAYLGRRPQHISRMMSGENNWTLNDMFKAARFVGVSLDVLTDPELTPSKAYTIVKGGERGGWSWQQHDAPEGGQSVVSIDDSRRPAGHGWPMANLTLAA